MQILLDSVILIDHFNNISLATEYLRRVRKESAISVITRLEVLTGIPPSEWSEPIKFLNYFPCLPFDLSTADKVAQLRQQHKWKTPDAIQNLSPGFHFVSSRLLAKLCWLPDWIVFHN